MENEIKWGKPVGMRLNGQIRYAHLKEYALHSKKTLQMLSEISLQLDCAENHRSPDLALKERLRGLNVSEQKENHMVQEK